MLLSIIIPVYNVEKYIADTLDSILLQDSYPLDYELIIVNDGTPDRSMDIVERYKSQFPKLTILNEENQGLSCARNAGLKLAQGDYVWFIDSDDTIPQNAFELLAPSLNNIAPEVLTFDINKVEENTGRKIKEKIFFNYKYYQLYNRQHSGITLNKKIHVGIVQRFIFQRDFLSKFQLSFTPNIIHEDIDFIVRTLLYSNRILPIDKPCYNYLLRSHGSIMSTFSIRSCTDRLKIIEQWEGLIKKQHLIKQQKKLIEDNVFNICYGLAFSPQRQVPSYQQFLKTNRTYIRRKGITAASNSLSLYFSWGKILKSFRLILSF